MNRFQRRDRLALRQTRVSVLAALALGLLFSSIQLVFDFQQEKQNLASTARGFLQILDQPVSFAAYQHDPKLAGELIVGFFSYRPVYYAEIKLINGEVLHSQQGSLVNGPYRQFSDLLFGPTIQLTHPLNYQPPPADLFAMAHFTQVGELTVKIDTYLAGRNFLDRAFRAIVSSLASAAALALVLLVFYHRFLTRPFVTIVNQTEAIDPERPESMRIALPSAHEKDEFGLLTNNINQLLGSIESNIETRLERAREAERLQTEMNAEKVRSVEMKQYQDVLQQTNEQLAKTVEQLQSTQEALVESNTLASLGGLVAGVAHELNTPIGVAVTSASYLTEQFRQIEVLHQKGAMTELDFTGCLSKSMEISDVLESNLLRAANLISSFKQVAVDQTHFFAENFDLKEYLSTVIASLSPEIKGTGLAIHLVVPDEISLKSFPGAFAQVVVNLLQNCLRHAFDAGEAGDLTIKAESRDDMAVIRFIDDGKGISPEDLPHIFKPFYTTKKGKGGTGLGLNILYNLIHQKLEGSIEVLSQLGHGTEFKITVPLNLKSETS